MTPTENWPKPWMLQLHAQAVEHGMIWVEPISEADAKSLRDRLYRIRRRSDKSMAAFIPPEYHLVMVGRWEPLPPEPSGPGYVQPSEDGETPSGRLPLIYNKRPDGKPLPNVRAASGEEIAERLTSPKLAEPVPIDLDSAPLEIDPEEIGSLVERLRRSARDRNNG